MLKSFNKLVAGKARNVFSLENVIYKNRPMPTLYICTARAGNADGSFSENSGKPEKLGTPIYGSQFRRQNRRQQVGAGTACRGKFSENFGNSETLRASFMALRVVERMRGSRWQSATPTQTVKKPPESSRGPQPFRTFNRAQRRVRWARGDFCAGKSHFPEQKSFPCSLRARKIFDF